MFILLYHDEYIDKWGWTANKDGIVKIGPTSFDDPRAAAADAILWYTSTKKETMQ